MGSCALTSFMLSFCPGLTGSFPLIAYDGDNELVIFLWEPFYVQMHKLRLVYDHLPRVLIIYY